MKTPELPEGAAGYMRGCNIDIQDGELLFTADQMRAYALLFKESGSRLAEIERLSQEVRYLRHYGNKDCTAMADAAIKSNELDA